MPQNSSQFLSSEHPCELKNLDAAVIFAGVENTCMLGKLAELEKLAVTCISVSTISTAVLNTRMVMYFIQHLLLLISDIILFYIYIKKKLTALFKTLLI